MRPETSNPDTTNVLLGSSVFPVVTVTTYSDFSKYQLQCEQKVNQVSSKRDQSLTRYGFSQQNGFNRKITYFLWLTLIVYWPGMTGVK